MRAEAGAFGGSTMLLIWGTRLYGRVDAVPGMFHVATRFGHLWYIPLIPMQSFVVLAQEGKAFRGAPIPLSWKSVLLAWARAGLIAAAVVLALPALGMMGDPRMRAAGAVGLAGSAAVVLAVVMAWRMKWCRLASYGRAAALAERVGLSDEGRIKLELAFGRVSKEEGAAALEAARRDRAEMARLRAELAAAPAGVE